MDRSDREIDGIVERAEAPLLKRVAELEYSIAALLDEWDEARGGSDKRVISGSVSQSRIDDLRKVFMNK